MKISVIIPAHNEVEHIVDCIESVYTQQTDHDVEIFLGDDASKDGTTEKIRTYAKAYSNIRAIHNAANVGVITTCQRLYERCTGDVILRIDADCTLRKGSLDAFADLIQDSDIVYGKVHVKNTDKLHPAACQYGKERGTGAWYGAACVGFTRSVIKEIGGFESVRQNLERELMNYAEENDISVPKTESVAVDSIFPTKISEWLPRKLSSGQIYVRECADSPSQFDPWELRGPIVWTGVISLLVFAFPIGLIALYGLFALYLYQSVSFVGISRKPYHWKIYPVYMTASGIARTVGVYRESPLLAKTVIRKYA